jgi:NADH:ubiquinone oxidoreductase subunit 5 (subunit L)/multisubunit Na+/H+ antiporter MnhA subunit
MSIFWVSVAVVLIVGSVLTWTARSIAPAVASASGGAALVLSVAGLGGALSAGGDVVGAALAVLVIGLTVVVQSFSRRHLRGDPRAGRFLVLSSLFAAASVVVVTASDAVILAGGWTAASTTMLLLLATGGAAQTRVAVRRAGVAFLIGDLALWAAVALGVTTLGTTDLDALRQLGGPTAAAVGALVAVAAVVRAASLPFHGWLPATVASTTPVSALLHAGFVNAGALLLFRFEAVPSVAAPLVAGLAGAATVVVASAAMLVRPDVKGRLVQSTAAQMGFMLLACSLGAFAVAFVHVIGHALFKASLFLGAGSAVERALQARRAPQAGTGRGMPVLAVAAVIAVAALAILGTGAWARPSAALLLFVVATAAVAAWRIAAGGSGRAWRIAAVAAVAGAVVVYVLAVAGVSDILALPAPAAAMPPLLAVLTFVACAGLALVARSRGGLADRAWVLALGWARPPLPVPSSVVPSSVPGHGPREYRSMS